MAITFERLREMLDYNPGTGVFIRLKSKKPQYIGQPAGAPNKLGYIQITLDGGKYYAHRLAWFWMTGEWPQDHIDHKDRNAGNNRWENLRAATNSQNMANTEAYVDNPYGLKGVTAHQGRFMARVAHKYIGMYGTPEEAREAYLTAAKELYGDFAR